jgi:hypothetical protein
MNITNNFRIDIFDPINIKNQIIEIVKVVPKSGCLNINIAAGNTISALLHIFNQLGIFSDQNLASSRIITGLTNSEGCKLNKPNGIHLIEPLVSKPKIKTITKSNKTKP